MGLHGWRLVSLIAAALLGGYLFSTALGTFLGSVLPLATNESTLVAHLSSFVFYTGAILWVFHMRKPRRAWISLLLSSVALAGLSLTLNSLSGS
ncbi:DUF3649 domain-containing protein [Microbulbifer sp.]|uniref:DUF3649 domain-containing protein n=1 Tax=Microbulbifer sp. TaxID=1908541 RepID=UPI002589E120|nr:DUF3649 domain-containing protein [Microbulbifer sp.]